MKKSDLRNIIKEEISRVIVDGLSDNNFKLNKIYEVMIPSHRDGYHELGETNYVVIAQDDITYDKLVLFTELHKEYMDRYDIISKLLQDDLGYKLINHDVGDNGHRWIFSKDGKNIDMDENSILEYYSKRPSVYDKILVRAEVNFLKEIKKNPLKLD